MAWILLSSAQELVFQEGYAVITVSGTGWRWNQEAYWCPSISTSTDLQRLFFMCRETAPYTGAESGYQLWWRAGSGPSTPGLFQQDNWWCRLHTVRLGCCITYPISACLKSFQQNSWLPTVSKLIPPGSAASPEETHPRTGALCGAAGTAPWTSPHQPHSDTILPVKERIWNDLLYLGDWHLLVQGSPHNFHQLCITGVSSG